MSITPDNHIIHGLWIGKTLSALELLTINSFIRFGHEFHLWVYEKPITILPPKTVLRDAEQIISAHEVYKRKKDDPVLAFGKGSFSTPFSDLFRYKLLYEEGGWWVDMDVTCLRPFSITAPFFFNPHPILPMMGNIMKCPKGNAMILETYQRVKQECNAETEDWLLPNRILNEVSKKYQLDHYIGKNMGNRDWWPDIEAFIYGRRKLPEQWFYFHWVNEMWRKHHLDKNRTYTASTLSRLMTQNKVNVKRVLLSANRKQWLRKTYEPDWERIWVDFKIAVVQLLRKLGLRKDG